jgi:hypothetical protein
MLGDDHIVERMRLGHLMVSAGQFPLRREVETVFDLAWPDERHRQFHVSRRYRLTRLREPSPEFGRHAGFEDREFEHEIAFAEEAAAVRPFNCFRLGSLSTMAVALRGGYPLIEPGRHGQPCQENERGDDVDPRIHVFR